MDRQLCSGQGARAVADTPVSRVSEMLMFWMAGSWAAHWAGRLPVMLVLVNIRCRSCVMLLLSAPQVLGRVPFSPGLLLRCRTCSAGNAPFEPHAAGTCP